MLVHARLYKLRCERELRATSLEEEKTDRRQGDWLGCDLRRDVFGW